VTAYKSPFIHQMLKNCHTILLVPVKHGNKRQLAAHSSNSSNEIAERSLLQPKSQTATLLPHRET